MIWVFAEFLKMSINAGCVVLIVVMVRLLISNAPKKYSYILWVVVFFRFIVPFTIQLPVNPVPVLFQPVAHDVALFESLSIHSEIPLVVNDLNSAADVTTRTSYANSENKVQITLLVGLTVWISGIVSLSLYFVLSYLKLLKKISTSIRVENNIYESDLIKSPFILGFLHPKIYVPIDFINRDSRHIMQHEYTHIIRRDYLIKPFALFVTIIHWFNPLAWIAYILLSRDMELSADENVLGQSLTDIRNIYSNSLLTLSAQKNGLLSQLAWVRIGVNSRIKKVLKYKKPTFFANAVSVVFVLAVSAIIWGFSLNTTSNAGSINTSRSLIVYIDESFSENDVIAIQDRIEAIRNVESLTFVGRHEALDVFYRLVEGEDSPPLEEMNEGDFRDRFIVYLTNPTKTQQTINNLLDIQGVIRIGFRTGLSFPTIT